MLIQGARSTGRAKTIASLVAAVGLMVVGCQVRPPAEPPAPEPSVVSDGPPAAIDMDQLVDRHTGPWVRFDGVLVPQAQPLFFIDGVRVEEAEMRALDEDDIYNIYVTRGPAATQRYGPEATGRVIEVVTKRGPVMEQAIRLGGRDPLLFIDGVRVEGIEDVRALDPNDIESIEIIKGTAATNLFGPEALNGVITVVMKRN